MKIARVLPIALLLIVALLAAACGGGAASPTSAPSGDNTSSGGDGPAAAVQAFFEAVYGGEENITDYVCSSTPEIVDSYEEAAEAMATLPDTTIDVSGLTYTVSEEDADSATVTVSGEITVSVAGTEQSTPFQDVPVPVVLEDGAWKVCGASVG